MTITVPVPHGTVAQLGAAAVAWASKQVGVKENPRYSNKVPFWNDMFPDYMGEPWCACFATDAWARQGIDLRKVLSDPYYCPNLEELGRDHNAWHSYSSGYDPQPGDIALMGRSGYASHTGLSAPADGNYSGYRQIEGNTCADDAGNQTNGDGVYIKFRGNFIRGWISMAQLIPEIPAAGKPTTEEEEDEMKESDWQRMERLVKAQLTYFQAARKTDLAAVDKQLHYDVGVVQNQNADLKKRLEALEAKLGVK